jgi:hypothetical protein
MMVKHSAKIQFDNNLNAEGVIVFICGTAAEVSAYVGKSFCALAHQSNKPCVYLVVISCFMC